MCARYWRARPGTRLDTCMKGEFNHVCDAARAARSLPRARSSLAYAPRRYRERLSNTLAAS
ncbi:hypothetical protein D6V42_23475 [Burkholderia contaminans]|nr:hypothetical protein [Burkholderia contaminans]